METTTQPLRLGEYLVSKGLLKPDDLAWALEIQQRTRERLGQILISRGLVRRYDLYQALAELWECPFVDLLHHPPDASLMEGLDPSSLLDLQMIPWQKTEKGLEIATSRRPDAALYEEAARFFKGSIAGFRVTTEWDIRQVVMRHFRSDVVAEATYGLYHRKANESAHTVFTKWQFIALGIILFGILLGLAVDARSTLVILNAPINFFFLAGILFKFVISLVGARDDAQDQIAVSEADVKALKESELPTYTILVPLYREANVIQTLLENLSRLDYPPEKLEIFLLIEEDDEETFQAAKRARPNDNVYFVIIPHQIPKTKPKACNVGLFFAGGDYLVIYDAEDRPEPDQLKKAVVAFKKGPPELICVQAALNYFNSRENFLTRMFTLEYSYWFDYMLVGLNRLGLPIPLGGTSNHFRTDRLRELGGWDPFNVTEDADLGIRAAVEGYKVGVINSTTFEEANTHVGNWIRQRSRWIKGYMQTMLVHLRDPIGLIKRVGLKQALAFFLLIGGTPLTFLASPWMWAMFLVWLMSGTKSFDILFPGPVLYVSLFNLLVGHMVAIYLNMLAVFRRQYYDLIPWALLNPFYWILHSIAAHKALWQLFSRPFFWEKTLHGLSRQVIFSKPVSESGSTMG